MSHQLCLHGTNGDTDGNIYSFILKYFVLDQQDKGVVGMHHLVTKKGRLFQVQKASDSPGGARSVA